MQNRRYRPALRDCRGFTLLEVLISLGVIAIVLVSVYHLYTQNLVMAESHRFYSLAPLLAQNKLAEMEIAASDGLDAGSGSFGEAYPGFTWEIEISESASEVLGEVAADLRRIDISVGYNEDEFTYDLHTYRLFLQQ
ncbi:MAG: prepilin-type N-terminal cleavage/methylation domain-containing protein [Desulfobacterales bacterium]